MIENFSLNIYIFYFLNSFAGQNNFLDIFWIFLAEYLIFFILFFYLIFFAKKIWEDKKIEIQEFFIYFSGAFIAWFLATGIKKALPSERPFSFLENVTQLIEKKPLTLFPSEYTIFSFFENVAQFIEKDPLTSFPSGHTTFSFALAFSIFLYDKKIGGMFLLLAFFVALGRIITGVHFPLDVVAGGILGIFISWFFWKLYKKITT